MKTYPHLSEKEIQLLSAYLDGELDGKQKEQVEALLAVSSRAVQMLKELKNTRQILRLLPTRKVPHDFTLTRLEAQGAKPGWMVFAMRVASGLSAVALTIVLAIDLLFPLKPAPQVAILESMADQAMPAMESAAAPMEKSMEKTEESEPPIINFSPAPQGEGIGGGGEMESGEEDPAQPEGAILPDRVLQPEQELSDADLGATAMEEEQFMEKAEIAEEVGVDKGAPSPGPILGIRPEEIQGRIIPFDTPIPQPGIPDQEEIQKPYLMLEIILLASAVLTFLVAFFLERMKRTSS